MLIYIFICILAFICESCDSSLGMGYGTILTPMLLLIGYQPLEIVPLILLSEFITGTISALMHHKIGNVNLTPGSRELKTGMILAACSIIGTITAANIALAVSKTFIKGYISFLLIGIGLITLFTVNKKYKFSWYKISTLGVIASFNKGISGGGYGPVLTGGQMLSGLNSKSAVGITSFAEGLTCLIGFITFALINNTVLDWKLGLSLLIGGICSIPVSVNIIKFIKERQLRTILSFAILLLGTVTFIITFQQTIYISSTAYVLTFLILVIPIIAYSVVKNK